MCVGLQFGPVPKLQSLYTTKYQNIHLLQYSNERMCNKNHHEDSGPDSKRSCPLCRTQSLPLCGMCGTVDVMVFDILVAT